LGQGRGQWQSQFLPFFVDDVPPGSLTLNGFSPGPFYESQRTTLKTLRRIQLELFLHIALLLPLYPNRAQGATVYSTSDVSVLPIDTQSLFLIAGNGRGDLITLDRKVTNLFKLGPIGGSFIIGKSPYVCTTNALLKVDLMKQSVTNLYLSSKGLSYITTISNLVVLSEKKPFRRLIGLNLASRSTWATIVPEILSFTASTTHIYVVQEDSQENNLTDSSAATVHTIVCISLSDGNETWKKQYSMVGAELAHLDDGNTEELWLRSETSLERISGKTGNVLQTYRLPPRSQISFVSHGNVAPYLIIASNEFDPLSGIAKMDAFLASIGDTSVKKLFNLQFQDFDKIIPINDLEFIFSTTGTTLLGFPVENRVFAGYSRCFDIKTGAIKWAKPGEYKTHLGSTIFCLENRGGDYALWGYDLVNNKDILLTHYSFEELFRKLK
jgi:hypothetical protein